MTPRRISAAYAVIMVRDERAPIFKNSTGHKQGGPFGHPQGHIFMTLMGGVVGTAVGFGAIVFQGMIESVARLSWGTLAGLRDQEVLAMALAAPLWGKILIPTTGGLIVGIIIWFVTRDSKGHGVSEVIEAVTLKGGRMSGRMVLADALASSLCIGSGGSGGIFAPALFLGAVLGGAFGQFANALLPATTASSGAYALVGMGAVFAGHISLETLRPILKDYDTMCDVVIASDLIEQSNTAVSSGDSLDMVMQFFGKYDLDEIPVMDNGGLIGVVRRSDVIEAYNREIFKLDMCSSLATSLSLQQKVHSQRVSLAEGFQILGANPLDEFTGKTLEELQLRERFSATVRTIKRELEGVDERVSYILPKPSTVIQKGDRLILFGLQKDLSRFPVV